MINLLAPIDMNYNIGICGYNIWKQFFLKDKDISLFPINNTASICPNWDLGSLQQSFHNQKQFNKEYPCLKIWYSYEMFTRISGNSPYYGLVSFKLDKFRQEELIGFDLLDKIFVYSNWAKNILLSNNIKKEIVVCSAGVDPSIFNKDIVVEKTEDKYIFINIGRWELAKSHDILIGIFNRAFSPSDNVELWMINYNPLLTNEENQKWYTYYKDGPMGDKIKIFPRIPSQESIAKIMQTADCGLFPSRAENWNSCILEMMSMNKPVIATNYGANTDYCNNQNSYLIDIDTTEPADDGLLYNQYGNWANFSEKQIDQTICHMRNVYKNNIRYNNYGVDTAKNYSWEKTAQILYENIV